MATSIDLCAVRNLRGAFEDKYFIDPSADLSGYVYIGNYSIVEKGCYLANALIGRFVHLENHVKVGKPRIFEDLILNHPFAYLKPKRFFDDNVQSNYGKKRYFYEKQPLTVIGPNSRICENAYIEAGVKIGRDSIILPNSVVINDIPAFSIVAGNPAQIIKYRFDEETRKALNKIQVENCDANSDIWQNDKFNFGDVSDFVKSKVSYSKVNVKRFCWGSYCKQLQSNTLVLGPSHVAKWIDLIKLNLYDLPNFELWGIGGLSVSSKSLINFCDFWLSLNNQNRVFILVPDFRIGNSSLVQNDRNATFIDKKLLKIENADNLLFEKYITHLQGFINSYRDKIKFIFWCQLGRDKINIRDHKHINANGVYDKLVTYDKLKKLFPENTVDITFSGDYFDLISDDSIHPTIYGYQLLEKLVNEN